MRARILQHISLLINHEQRQIHPILVRLIGRRLVQTRYQELAHMVQHFRRIDVALRVARRPMQKR